MLLQLLNNCKKYSIYGAFRAIGKPFLRGKEGRTLKIWSCFGLKILKMRRTQIAVTCLSLENSKVAYSILNEKHHHKAILLFLH